MTMISDTLFGNGGLRIRGGSNYISIATETREAIFPNTDSVDATAYAVETAFDKQVRERMERVKTTKALKKMGMKLFSVRKRNDKKLYWFWALSQKHANLCFRK